ncbi:MAG: hypothetical protein ACYSW1_16580 [Planctomycetota bacterium]
MAAHRCTTRTNLLVALVLVTAFLPVSFLIGWVIDLVWRQQTYAQAAIDRSQAVIEAHGLFAVVEKNKLGDGVRVSGSVVYTSGRREHRAGLFTTRIKYERRFRYRFHDKRPHTPALTQDLRLAYDMYLRSLRPSPDRDWRIASLAMPDGVDYEWRWWLTWINGMIATSLLISVAVLMRRVLARSCRVLLERTASARQGGNSVRTADTHSRG